MRGYGELVGSLRGESLHYLRGFGGGPLSAAVCLCARVFSLPLVRVVAL